MESCGVPIILRFLTVTGRYTNPLPSGCVRAAPRRVAARK